MPEHAIAARNYVLICVVLIALTFVTIGVSLLPITGQWHVILGLTIAVCKASLVGLFFMHLLISSRLTWIVVIVAVFWLVILVTLTLADYVSRGMIPYMPGH